MATGRRCDQLHDHRQREGVVRIYEAVRSICSKLCKLNDRQPKGLDAGEQRYASADGWIRNARPSNDPVLVKTHWPFMDGSPLSLMQNAAVLQLARHPLTQFFALKKHRSHVADPAQGGSFKRSMRAWIGHHSMWRRYARLHDLPLVLVRYESMVVNQTATFEQYTKLLSQALPGLFVATNLQPALASAMWPALPLSKCRHGMGMAATDRISVSELKWLADEGKELLNEFGYAASLASIIKKGAITPATACEVAHSTANFELPHLLNPGSGSSGVGTLPLPASACKSRCCFDHQKKAHDFLTMHGRMSLEKAAREECKRLFDMKPALGSRHSHLPETCFDFRLTEQGYRPGRGFVAS